MADSESEYQKALLNVNAVGSVESTIAFLKSLADSYNDIQRLYMLPDILNSDDVKAIPIGELFNKIEILPSEELYLSSIKVGSPGFWEIVGSLNPLNFIIELIKLIMDWKFRNEDRKLLLAKFRYESVNSYLELLEKYNRVAAKYEKNPSEHNRFVKTMVEKIILDLEKNVIPYVDKKSHSKLLGADEKPKIHLTSQDLQSKSRSISGFLLNILNPENEMLQDLDVLVMLAEQQGKMSQNEILDGLNAMIDSDLVAFDSVNRKITPTQSGLSLLGQIS